MNKLRVIGWLAVQGLTADEIRKANRRRNAAIKNKQKEQKK